MPASPYSPAPAHPPRTGGGAARTAGTIVWALLPLLLPMLGAPLAFGLAVGRRASAVTLVPLVLYSVALGAFFLLLTSFELATAPAWVFPTEVLAMLATTIGASAHLFAIRKYVWVQGPRQERTRTPAAKTTAPSAGDWVAPALERERQLREDARRLAEADPSLAKRNGIGRPDQPRRLDDGGLVDLNHAPAAVLRDLPGFTEATAARVVERVERLGPFQSLDEVILEVEVAPGFERHLREYAILIP
ncbi:helix-hairpin-helix domain-containing protein [Glycomyces sp. NRRL B-16210]|uniref:ComEA family DNA-binding protein n=1 Tax=Glycomyces sp. NRRL B-16210 TaxID=1463821 RepID=UPI00068DF234|nr:helix-hairpin-helix domain-containing protein [Glycomyces sp. NRRL B-16210]